MTAPAIPAAPDAFSDTTVDADAARRAIRDSDESSNLALVLGDGATDTIRDADSGSSSVADTGRESKRGRGRPKKNLPPVGGQPAGVSGTPPADDPSQLSQRALRRLKKTQLRPALLAIHARNQELQRRVEELTAASAVTTAVDSEQVGKSLRFMLSDVIGLLDTGSQLVVGEQLAPAVALDDQEKNHLVELAEPVAREQLGAQVVNSPWLALGLGVGALAFAKYLAYRDAKNEIARRQAETPHAVATAAARSTAKNLGHNAGA